MTTQCRGSSKFTSFRTYASDLHVFGQLRNQPPCDHFPWNRPHKHNIEQFDPISLLALSYRFHQYFSLPRWLLYIQGSWQALCAAREGHTYTPTHRNSRFSAPSNSPLRTECLLPIQFHRNAAFRAIFSCYCHANCSSEVANCMSRPLPVATLHTLAYSYAAPPTQAKS